jgi:hypothetical protein
MNVLIAGASGATGRLLAEQLLERGHKIKAIVRTPEKLPEKLKNHKNFTFTAGNLLDLSEEELAGHTEGCDAVTSCLGHNPNFKGIYGRPRRLVTDATRRLCDAIRGNKPGKEIRYILMNTAGNSNRDLDEKISAAQKIVLGIIRLLLPPHVDNEKAADFLRTGIGQQSKEIGWSVVRPDGLIDENEVSKYEVHPSPTSSAIFKPGKTSRINVAHFMAELVSNDQLWNEWKGRMPVIYNTLENKP